jgi:hypothetical protein
MYCTQLTHKPILGRLRQDAPTKVGNNATKKHGVRVQEILILNMYEIHVKIDDRNSYTLSPFSKISKFPLDFFVSY